MTKALRSHGHSEILDVRQGKFFEIELQAGPSAGEVLESLERIAAEVLSNPVIEDYEVELLAGQ